MYMIQFILQIRPAFLDMRYPIKGGVGWDQPLTTQRVVVVDRGDPGSRWRTLVIVLGTVDSNHE